MELKLTKATAITPVECILVKKGEIALGLIIFVVVICTIHNKPECFKSFVNPIGKLKVESFEVTFFD